jgi:MFS transporter, DHA2 family, multidrug resistance protein
VPVFTQTLLGFTATDTGLLLLPGSISTAFMMPFIGKAMQRGVSPRLLAGTGFFLFFVFTQLLSRFTDQVGAHDFFWPLVVRGLGLGMLFIPLTTLALADLRGAEIPQGTAMTNMARQLGGSVGIALMTTFVSRRTTFHKAVLSEKVTEYGQEGLQRLRAATNLFLSKGDAPWDARVKGVAALTRTVYRQAVLLSYLDAFRLVGIFFLVMLPFLLLFKKPVRGGAVAEGVHAE